MDVEKVKEYLKSYADLKRKVKRQREIIIEAWNETQIPAIKPSDGSQRLPGGKGRLESSSIRHMDRQAKAEQTISECEDQMQRIRDAVECIKDPNEKDALFYRYMTGNGSRLTKWRLVAVDVLGDDDEKDVQAVKRYAKQGLQSLGRILEEHEEYHVDL